MIKFIPKKARSVINHDIIDLGIGYFTT
jgi:hypothetical protein